MARPSRFLRIRNAWYSVSSSDASSARFDVGLSGLQTNPSRAPCGGGVALELVEHGGGWTENLGRIGRGESTARERGSPASAATSG
jgi:hypothetical protein